MGLLAFLLAVIFNMAASRFDSRNQAVMQEAYAIGTAYLRADFLPETAHAEMKQLLRDYTEMRAVGLAVILSEEGMAKASDTHDKLWRVFVNRKGGLTHFW